MPEEKFGGLGSRMPAAVPDKTVPGTGGVGSEFEGRSESGPLGQLRQMIKGSYSLQEVAEMQRFLEDRHTFDFPTLQTGLYSAAVIGVSNEYTGYSNVWVRDNVHIASARYETGHKEEGAKAMASLMTYFTNERHRFEDVVRGAADPAKPMNRPHVRIDGENLRELDQKWPHAQNDALGYFLWSYSKMAHEGAVSPTHRELEQLAYFPLYFKTIEFWRDADNGHWEETPKVEASSIGTVVGGLRSLRDYLVERGIERIETGHGVVDGDLINDLIEKGSGALGEILPFESRQPGAERAFDSSLLFLREPLGVIGEAMTDRILADVKNNLEGDHGIRRYNGDSFWSANFKQKHKQDLPGKRWTVFESADVGAEIHARDALLVPGQEAQWCIFDSIISAIYGQRYQKTGSASDLNEQIKYFNRSVAQVTEITERPGQLLCPELYYLENGTYVPNDVVPFLWSSANLSRAFMEMQRSLSQ
jgi:hypothetical protein